MPALHASPAAIRQRRTLSVRYYRSADAAARPANGLEKLTAWSWRTGQQQALVTINERKFRYSLIAHVPFKTAQTVSDTMISLLTPFAACVHTLTTDNGKEFAQHERIAKKLDADFFFAHPYSSWERGANENLNGLIRQFFPKKMRFDSITGKDIAFTTYRLNHRPRKCFGFKTPHEVFMKQLHSRQNAVALQSGENTLTMTLRHFNIYTDV